MSKRQSKSKNTLFNYFSPTSSASNNENSKNRPNLPEENETPKKTKEKRQPDNCSDDENIQPTKRRRRIISHSDSDSDSEKLIIDTSSEKSENHDKSSPVKEPSTSFNAQALRRKLTELPTPDKEFKFKRAKESKPENKEEVSDRPAVLWTHEKLVFLKPEYIKDSKGKRPGDPYYNPRSIFVPSDFLSKQTPAMRQWWDIKSENFDCVLFFKVGKFYELYHMDAVIGVNELGFSFMKGEFAHSGFPEGAYGRFSSSLIELGYKVARVEQTETPEMMHQRCTGSRVGKQEKVVRREVCQITNRATQVNAVQDMDIKRALPEYLFAINQCTLDDTTRYGVCFVDTAVGCFYIGQFEDDEHNSKLSTLLAEHPPAAILEERNNLSKTTKSLLKTTLGNIPFEALSTNSEFYMAQKTIEVLVTEGYFKDKSTGKMNWPSAFKNMILEDDIKGRVCKTEYYLALRCLGAIHWYLKTCLLDIQLFTIGKMEQYFPASETKSLQNRYMILDASSLSNLHILGPTGSLQATVDYCNTQFGKRLLKQWICRPLCDTNAILKRQEAVSDFLHNPELLSAFRTVLSQLPDLERQLAKIHTLGSLMRSKQHPDSRAVFYEEKKYSKKKILMFMATLVGFEKAFNLVAKSSDFKAALIKHNISLEPKGKFPDIQATIKFFKTAFNHAEAEKEGKIIPKPGMDEEYDKTLQTIENIKRRAAEYLKEQEKYFGCKIAYFGNDKKRYQLDIPDSACRKLTDKYYLEGAKKGSKPSKRYHTDITRQILSDTLVAEKANREILQDLNRRIFEKFSSNYENWIKVVDCLAELDCLMSLAEYVRNQSVIMTKPIVVPSSKNVVIDLELGVHPFIPNIENFVPNDAELGTENHPTFLMLTGPNMGGKSTLMRQVALLTIMAHLGCYVPAKHLKLSLVDRIFTRLGARDDIMAGSSTFHVELREALAILQHATTDSLVLLDELGRGTSTFDGTAIAAAYVDSLTEMKCRTIFSTHYYNVVEHFKHHPSIQLGHMACKVESDEEDVTQETVTFMYKMIPGACPKSYGFNAARLAGIPRSITNRASEVSRRIEMETINRKMFIQLFCDGENLRGVLESLQSMSL